NRLPVPTYIDENRRSRHVVVGRIVMNELEEPLQFARIAIERKDGVAVEILARDRAIRVTSSGKDLPRRLVSGQIRPDIAAAPILPCIARPFFVVRLTGLRDDVKAPDEFPSDRVPRADVAARLRRGECAAGGRP